jgi:hypothetical protein
MLTFSTYVHTLVSLLSNLGTFRDRCYDFFFAEKLGEKIAVFDSKQS